MRKGISGCLIASLIMGFVGALFFLYALFHPEASVNVNGKVVDLFYAIYILITIFLFVFGVWKTSKSKG